MDGQKTGNKSTGLATIDGEWAIKASEESIPDLLRENLGSEGISPFDLPKVSVPTGGGISFMVPGIGGETAEKELLGVILHTRMTRAWYENSFEEAGGGNPPDCLSEDGIHGVGIQAEKLDAPALCEACPMSKWDSDRRGGGGQDCASVRPIFLLRRGDLLPIRVNAPSGSVASARRFLLGCTLASLRYFEVVTRLTLEKKKQRGGGIEYAALAFEISAPLDPASRAIIDEMRKALAPMFSAISAADVAAT